ncbi:hypothetical protein [Microbacterium aurugineum]|uniref:DUF4935 domain-containing protein n=1 Tax=Microbacterium aurugineum TaxID=2851642 RepID=A0ABY4J0E2_9MICO|nr:hypothetical protein [Microbacterium aurugineum]UPL17495.1 hypothetical protein KV397_06885 [Microbacterium aurugineum]
MTVVVVDTNALPRGHFSLPALERLLKVAGDASTVVVPEVVVWEWAEHAHSSYVAVEEAAKAVRVDPSILSRPVVDPAPAVEELAERILNSLPVQVKLWSPDREVWRAALRDQVLQVGSGETKSDVKTGAADAVVLACVEAESSEAEDVVLLVTNDRKLRSNALLFDNVRCSTGDKGLLAAMYSFTPATDDLELRLMEQLPEYMNELIGVGGDAVSFSEYGVSVHFGDGHGGWPAGAVLSSLWFNRIDIAEIHDLQVESGEGKRRGLAELRVFGVIKGMILEYHDPKLGALTASRTEVDFSQDFVDVTVEVEWDLNWRIHQVRATGSAVLVQVGPMEDESDDDGVNHFWAMAEA